MSQQLSSKTGTRIGTASVPAAATAVRLVRLVGEDMREYEAMECASGARGISLLFRQAFASSGDYGLADLLDDGGNIVGEIDLDRRSFQLVKKRLGCRWIRAEELAYA